MKIEIICVGKLKKEIKDIYSIYISRIEKACSFNIIELKEKNIDLESEDIIKVMKSDFIKILLSPEGKIVNSHDYFGKLFSSHVKIQFIIGGAEGVNNAVFKNSDRILSFSQLIFPHQLFRVMLMEQIYRGICIINNHPYHKV